MLKFQRILDYFFLSGFRHGYEIERALVTLLDYHWRERNGDGFNCGCKLVTTHFGKVMGGF